MKRYKKINKKKIVIMSILIPIWCLVMSFFIYSIWHLDRYDKKIQIEKSKPSITELNLDTSEKIEDFEYLYDVISTSFPMLKESKFVTGTDFVSNKEKYIKKIKSTKNDYEFYIVMREIIQDLYSLHTDIIFPSRLQYKTLGCFNNTKALATEDVLATSDYWYNILKEKNNEFKNIDEISFNYINGEYYRLSNNIQEAKYKLVSVNNVACDDYVLKKPKIATMQYDFFYNKTYVNKIIFNNSIGEPVELKLQDENGVYKYVNCFYSKEYENNYFIKKVFEKSDTFLEIYDNMYTYLDTENSIFYIQVNNMSMFNGDLYLNSITDLDKAENIIIDFRNNYGGNKKFGQEYLYPTLFSKDVVDTKKWYMIDSKYNKNLELNSFLQEIKFKIGFKQLDKNDQKRFSNSDIKYKEEKTKYTGGNVKDRNIYILIGNGTGSAADGFVSVLKNNNLATLIGQNTSGEGRADSFAVEVLPNSKLLFIYMFGKGYNMDGTDNSLYGTSPDIYVNYSFDGYIKKAEMLNKDKDINLYENRLIWDDVLKTAVNEIVSEE